MMDIFADEATLVFVVWLAIAGILVIAEVFTAGFFSIFFALGAVITAFATVYAKGLPLQLVIFLVSSSLLAYFARPIARKFFGVHDKPVKDSNVDALKGQEVMVLETIRKHNGRVKILHTGEVWSACLDHVSGIDEIPEGEEGVIERVDGARLIIRPKS